MSKQIFGNRLVFYLIFRAKNKLFNPMLNDYDQAMKLKVLAGLMARKRKHDHHAGFTPLSNGEYHIRALDGNQFQITKPNGVICYLSSAKLEEKIQAKSVALME
ncbi:hypothetical protein [Polynucleobacter sp. AP-Kaivos-20-H2]|uniref:hypothetical protein n=1 Tax=Polynucleobacter sp. AP-Kaivos-20-H2 TaxID=2689104 RepID=UPI001C0DD9DB|nr:hypothetical protein [Polynucleobacter sp. AP-Kaivos-20-H2]MBU3605078.1 hypothetical protein [Polynucleobacter sp. AP-Kaivos-20-H2]